MTDDISAPLDLAPLIDQLSLLFAFMDDDHDATVDMQQV